MITSSITTNVSPHVHMVNTLTPIPENVNIVLILVKIVTVLLLTVPSVLKVPTCIPIP